MQNVLTQAVIFILYVGIKKTHFQGDRLVMRTIQAILHPLFQLICLQFSHLVDVSTDSTDFQEDFLNDFPSVFPSYHFSTKFSRSLYQHDETIS